MNPDWNCGCSPEPLHCSLCHNGAVHIKFTDESEIVKHFKDIHGVIRS